ncbi:helix-turn-helix transcriptional regulator [Embleya sp. NBC_00896]|uniref:helix-turn-helix transcriptional regulator n=1 Tax=Embleya sp. NBC_00896 TaxID=2975961 RepID=UPI0038655628|nr:helix-turn-helix domain-containing protein [Embleya sp. NBC_00896]
MTDSRIRPLKSTAPRPLKPSDKLTLPEVLEEIGVSRSTFYYWRQLGKAPRCIRLPNGELRVRRSVLDAWLESLEEAA